MQTIEHSLLPIPASTLAALQRGKTIAVHDDTHTIAFLVPAHSTREERPCGLAKGEFTVPGDFDDPDPAIEALFYGDA